MSTTSTLLRDRDEDDSGKVGMVELFFDLVFVFAVTQLSHALASELSVVNALRVGLLIVAVWWVWVFTAWATNWLEPENGPVRAMLFGLMLAGLAMSVAIPGAFGDRGMLFAGAYVLMQLGRTLFVVWAVRADRALRLNFIRILIWLAAAAPFWLLGAWAEGWGRFALWLVALGIELASPALYFRVPVLGPSTTGDWSVEGSHMAERCGLFIIIALGESLLMTGGTYSGIEHPSWPATAAFALGFASAVAMWWIYFDIGAGQGVRHIEESDDPGRMARRGYTYLHLPIVAGVIIAAVADEVVLHHPTGDGTALPEMLVILGGPFLFLAGNAAFKAIPLGHWPLSHQVGMGLLGALVLASVFVSPVVLSALSTLVLVVVAVWENRSLGGSAKEAGPAEALPRADALDPAA